MRKARVIALTAGAGALASALVAGAVAAPAATAAVGSDAATATPAVVIKPGVHQLPQAKTLSTPWTTALCESQLNIACYEPDQIRAAYNEAPLLSKGITGKGATIVIVDSFGSPTIKSDLSTFDKQFGYPDPPSFKILTPAGKIPAWDPNNADMTGWGGETTLDVEYAHAVAPGANIVLVETPVSETEGVTGFPEIVKAEKYVIDHGIGDVISQSFDATEETFTRFKQVEPLRAAYKDAYAHGVTVLAATGGDGGRRHAVEGGLGRHVLVGGVERHLRRPAPAGVHRHQRPQCLRHRRRGVRVLQPTVVPGRRRAGDRRGPRGAGHLAQRRL